MKQVWASSPIAPLAPIAVPLSVAVELARVPRARVRWAIERGEIEARFRGWRCLVDYADLQGWIDALPADTE